MSERARRATHPATMLVAFPPPLLSLHRRCRPFCHAAGPLLLPAAVTLRVVCSFCLSLFLSLSVCVSSADLDGYIPPPPPHTRHHVPTQYSSHTQTEEARKGTEKERSQMNFIHATIMFPPNNWGPRKIGSRRGRKYL